MGVGWKVVVGVFVVLGILAIVWGLLFWEPYGWYGLRGGIYWGAFLWILAAVIFGLAKLASTHGGHVERPLTLTPDSLRPPPPTPVPAPGRAVTREIEVITRERVLIKCSYCGNKVEQGTQACPACGGRL